jgi:hypothetical protein
MPPPDRPQLRFLARVLVLFAAALALWWLVLVGPLLQWVRLSTAVLLDAAGGFRMETAVIIQGGGVWMIQAPVPAAPTTNLGRGVRFRSLKLPVAQWIPTLQTVSLPLFWALILAAPPARGWWRALALGSVVLLLFPPLSLLVYSAHVVQRTLYPNSLLRGLLDFADYVCGTALPYIAPVVVALAVNRELRAKILGATEYGTAAGPSRRKVLNRTRTSD